MYDKVETLLEKLAGLGKWTVSRDDKAQAIYRRIDGTDDEGRIFLVVHEASDPLLVDVGLGKDLARLLAGKYESVSPSRLMDAKSWVEVICSGQLSDEEVIDLIRASWERAGE